jgi:serine/threonine protein kinase
VARLRREAIVLCSLRDSRVLVFHGVVFAKAWLVTEVCVGGALRELLDNKAEPLSLHEQMRLAAETALGVAYLHSSEVNFCHGDLKAANVLLTAERQVRLADFGSAKAGMRTHGLTVTAGGCEASSSYTTCWAAPELFCGSPVCAATDIFALGITLWEIFTRDLPFKNMQEDSAQRAIENGERPALDNTTVVPTKRAVAIIRACWEQQPDKRLSANSVAAVLQKGVCLLDASGGGDAAAAVGPSPVAP